MSNVLQFLASNKYADLFLHPHLYKYIHIFKGPPWFQKISNFTHCSRGEVSHPCLIKCIEKNASALRICPHLMVLIPPNLCFTKQKHVSILIGAPIRKLFRQFLGDAIHLTPTSYDSDFTTRPIKGHKNFPRTLCKKFVLNSGPELHSKMCESARCQ